MKTQTIKEIRNAVRSKYAWPGGYPLYLVMQDCEAMCINCARENWRNIAQSIRYGGNDRFDGWIAVGAEVNWEDDSLYCCHCYQKIESAYGGEE